MRNMSMNVGMLIIAVVAMAASAASAVEKGQPVSSPEREGSPAGQAKETSILFIGNSFTYVNDLPGMIAALAKAGGAKAAGVRQGDARRLLV